MAFSQEKYPTIARDRCTFASKMAQERRFCNSRFGAKSRINVPNSGCSGGRVSRHKQRRMSSLWNVSHFYEDTVLFPPRGKPTCKGQVRERMVLCPLSPKYFFKHPEDLIPLLRWKYQ
ncbi:hypothetical protein AVEN_62970-1 [Araneus ventricosus]|uniref:Uncharacterized protein n=1 Tax=Araneus ventricosus TaxID=182803 RepID=A0A4Y2KFE8_ARAVE|nr:hypothetical protein AVEN_62970-1 [Araneus ventricosus]